MNLERLGRFLAVVEQEQAVPKSWLEPIGDALAFVETAIETLNEGYSNVFEEKQDAEAPVDENDYHCDACEMYEAPVEELSLSDKVRYLTEDFYDNVDPFRKDELRKVSPEYYEANKVTINMWFNESRQQHKETIARGNLD